MKIALKTGTPMVPIYGFGHTACYTCFEDPFGLLEQVSLFMNVSVVPFLGRWFWPLGPPKRDNPVAVCCGEPIVVPLLEEPCQEEVDRWHAELLKGFEDVFNRHKDAYGWQHKTLRIV